MSFYVRFKIPVSITCERVQNKAEDKGYPILIGSKGDHGFTWIRAAVIFSENAVLQPEVKKENYTDAWTPAVKDREKSLNWKILQYDK